jgi:hypothetical protein
VTTKRCPEKPNHGGSVVFDGLVIIERLPE